MSSSYWAAAVGARWRRSCRQRAWPCPTACTAAPQGACARRALTEGVKKRMVCVEARARFADRPPSSFRRAPLATPSPSASGRIGAQRLLSPARRRRSRESEHRKVTFGAPLCPSCRRRSCPFARRVSWRSRTAHASLPLFHIRLLRPGLLVVVVRAMAEQQFPDLFITQPLCDKCACD